MVPATAGLTAVIILTTAYRPGGIFIRNGAVDGVVIYEGKLASLQRENDLVKEVKNGYECGMLVENFNDIKEGDIIESYEMVEQRD